MTERKAICVIPARLESTRLEQKLLRPVGGRPILEWVYRNARKAKGIDRVIVACDHQKLKACVESFGGEAMLTGAHHKSGTERIAEVAERLKADIYVNVQGDEPLMHCETIEGVVEVLRRDVSCLMSTACIKKIDSGEYQNPNVVKVVKDKNGWALYFSRATIPFDRQEKSGEFYKHLGIYGYRRDFLIQIPKLKPSTLEEREKLEQLRVLENGFRIRIIETVHDSIGVDTQEDLEAVEKLLSSKNRIGV